MSREYPCIYHDNGRCRKYPKESGEVDYCVFGPCADRRPSNGDRFRNMSDEELVEKLYQEYLNATDWQEFSDRSMKWCDGKSGCIDEHGEIECDEDRHKACILRWLKGPADDE